MIQKAQWVAVRHSGPKELPFILNMDSLAIHVLLTLYYLKSNLLLEIFAGISGTL